MRIDEKALVDGLHLPDGIARGAIEREDTYRISRIDMGVKPLLTIAQAEKHGEIHLIAEGPIQSPVPGDILKAWLRQSDSSPRPHLETVPQVVPSDKLGCHYGKGAMTQSYARNHFHGIVPTVLCLRRESQQA
jgi:hypothetical protein